MEGEREGKSRERRWREVGKEESGGERGKKSERDGER